MLFQKINQILNRIIFYLLLVPLMLALVYSLSNDMWTIALVSLVLTVLVLYFGLIRITIPACSLLVCNGKVESFVSEKTVCNRFDLASRGQTIVTLPHYGVLDRPYKLELCLADGAGSIRACRLLLQLGYSMEPAGLQRAYDSFIRFQDYFPLEIKKRLYLSASSVTCPTLAGQVDDVESFLQPLVVELNHGLEPDGVKIEHASCTVASRPVMAYFISGEQDVVEKSSAAPAGTA